MIMAGGFGTRLKPLTCNLPKPMVPMANKPMMERIIELLKRHGITEIIPLLYYQPEKIKNYFGDGSKFGVNINYVQASEDYGTAGSVRNAQDHLDERFIVISGDLLTDFDLTAALNFHQQKKAALTVLLTRVKDPLSYGVVLTDQEGRIVRFLEKPSWGQVFSDTINTGIYILEPKVLGYIPLKKEFDFSKDLFPLLMERGEALYGYVAKGYWKDVGDLREYQQANLDCLEGKVEVTLEGKEVNGVRIGKGCSIALDAEFEGPVLIGNNCIIESGVKISRSIIGNRCRIGRDSILRNSILWDKVLLEERVSLTSDIVATNTRIEEGAFLQENVFVSDNCRIGRNSRIKANVKIWPEKSIEAGAFLTTSLIWGDRWLRELFTGSKVSGVINIEVSPEFGSKLGAAFGAFIGAGNYVVSSRDASDAARMINRALICGFMSAGVNISALRITPIPIVRYILRSGNERGGIHVRKSPYDERQVDIIFLDADGRDLPVGKAKAIERLFMREDFLRASPSKVGRLDFPVRVTESYSEDFLKHLDIDAIERAHFKVVIDYSYGGASLILPSILGSLDCEVVSLNAYLDPKKLTRTRREFNRSIKQLSTIVTSLEADIGFLIDPNAEKIYVVDEKGQYIDSDRLLVLVTKMYLDSHRPEKIAVPISASLQIEELAHEKGVEVIRTRDDHNAMIEASLTEGVDFVGGTKGGFIFSDFHFACDGMFAMAKILELMAKTRLHLGELFKGIHPLVMIRKNIPCPWEAKGRVMRNLMDFSQGMKRQLIDGVKIFYEDASVLVLPDKEGAFFHLVAEAEDQKRVESLVREFGRRILYWRDSTSQ